MHRPGIIPLRPLNLSDIFGGALSTLRHNKEATFGMATLVLGLFLLPSLGITLLVDELTRLSSDDVAVIDLLLPTLLSVLATLAVTGFIIYVVSEAAVGDKVGLGQTWRAVRARLPALVGVTVLTTLALVLLVVLLVVGIVLAVELGGVGGVLFGILLGLGAVLLVIWATTRLSLAAAPVVLERAGPLTGIARSWRLTSGRQFWRVLGIYLLAQILVAIIASAISTPLQLGVVFAIGENPETGTSTLLLVLFQHVAQFITGLIVIPFTAAVLALLYVDQRIRREGLDLTLGQTARQRAAERSGL